jgi:hypothetical protein
MNHNLKVHPEYFDALADGSKPFEVRKDDRQPPFAVGDTLTLREWDPEYYAAAHEPTHKQANEAAYTGRALPPRRVTYVLRGYAGIAPGYVVMGLERGDEDDAQRLRDALHEIAQWALDAYPVEMFPDQDLDRTRQVLDAAGISLSALYGQWAQHLIGGIGGIARGALEPPSAVEAFDALRAAVGGAFDGVDVEAYMREQRED